MATNPLFEWPALASQLQELGQRPQWPHAAERKQLMVRYTGTLQAFALAVPVHIREDWSSFKVAWDQRPKEIEPHPLASNAKPQAMPVSGASLSASHYWVLFWVRAVRTPGTTFGRDHLSGNVSTFSRGLSATLKTDDVEAVLFKLWPEERYRVGLASLRKELT